MAEESCATCKFWQVGTDLDGDFGRCRRSPPLMPMEDIVLRSLAIAAAAQGRGKLTEYADGPGCLPIITVAARKSPQGVWLTTYHEDWCGEYQRRDAT